MIEFNAQLLSGGAAGVFKSFLQGILRVADVIDNPKRFKEKAEAIGTAIQVAADLSNLGIAEETGSVTMGINAIVVAPWASLHRTMNTFNRIPLVRKTRMDSIACSMEYIKGIVADFSLMSSHDWAGLNNAMTSVGTLFEGIPSAFEHITEAVETGDMAARLSVVQENVRAVSALLSDISNIDTDLTLNFNALLDDVNESVQVIQAFEHYADKPINITINALITMDAEKVAEVTAEPLVTKHNLVKH